MPGGEKPAPEPYTVVGQSNDMLANYARVQRTDERGFVETLCL